MAKQKAVSLACREIEKAIAWNKPPNHQGNGWTKNWLEQLCHQLNVSSGNSDHKNEVASAEWLLDELGGSWEGSFSKGGEITTHVIQEIGNLIGLQMMIQECIGLGKMPFCDHQKLYISIFQFIIKDDDLEDEVVSSSPVKSLLCRVFDCKEKDLDESLLNARGVLSKVAQEEVLSFIESMNSVAEDSGQQEDDTDGKGVKELSDSESLAWEKKPVAGTVDKYPLSSVMVDIDDGLLELDPPWQRGDVWSLKKKRELINSILLGIPLPSVIVHKQQDTSVPDTVIDGKQRLTALHEFYKGKWKLPKYPDDSPLEGHSRKKYSDLDPGVQKKFRDTHLIQVQFTDLPKSTLYKVFELYNISGTRLNSTEIRNAVFQDHPLHKMLYSLAGEGYANEEYVAEQEVFTQRLRTTIARNGRPPRYGTLEFLSRYLAYSRAPVSSKSEKFVAGSTTKVIQTFFEDPNSFSQSVEDLAQEIVDVYQLATDLYMANGIEPFSIKGAGRQRNSFSKLRATNSLICGYVILKVGVFQNLTKEQRIESIKTVDQDVPYPEKQQTKSIWQYHAETVCRLLALLEVSDDVVDQSGLRHLATEMEKLLS